MPKRQDERCTQKAQIWQCQVPAIPIPRELLAARHDDERGFATRAGILAGRRLRRAPPGDQERQDLDGLAETHVVGEAAAPRHLVEEAQPAETELLIGAQLSLEGL